MTFENPVGIKKDLAKFFDDITDYLDKRWLNKLVGYYIVQRRVENIVCMSDIQCNHTILDAGCGTGTPLLVLSRFARTIIGIDLSLKSVRRAKSKLRKIFHCDVHLLGADVEYLPFKNKVFDAVVSIELLEHVSKPRKVLMEQKRVLNINGRVAASVPNMLCPWHYTLRKLLVKLKPKVFMPPIDGAFSSSGVADLYENVGFRRIKRKFLGFLIPETPKNLFSFLRLAEKLLEKIPITKIFSGWIIITGLKGKNDDSQ